MKKNSLIMILMVFVLAFAGYNLISQNDTPSPDGDNLSTDQVEETGKDNSIPENQADSDLQFRNQERFLEHYEKHVLNQEEFGEISEEDYLELARQLMDQPSDTVLTKQDGDDTIYYDPDTNSFGVKSGDGYIRTFFKPGDGIEYFNRQ